MISIVEVRKRWSRSGSIVGSGIELKGLACLTLLVTACSTHMVPIKYAPASREAEASFGAEDVRIGRVDDSRGTASNWLGAIRGGYGNPLKKLYTEKATREVVKDVFEEALKTRSSGAGGSPRHELNVDIRKFDCSYYFNREAHAHLNVELVSLQNSPRVVYSRLYKEDRTESGVGAGIFGSVEHLRAFAEKTLTGAIDQVLADDALHRELLAPESNVSANDGSSTSD